MRIVPVTEENVAYFTGLCKELHNAGTFGIHGPDFEWDYTLDLMRTLTARDDYYMRMAYDDEDKPCGLVGGHIMSFYFSPKIIAYEDAWYVREGTKMRARTAIALMRGLMGWALDEKKALLLETGDVASIDSTAVWELYKRMGFVHFGTLYKYSRGLT